MAKQLRITSDTSGSVDGIHTQSYQQGEVLQCDGRRMTEKLGSLLVEAGDAEWVQGHESRETKPAGPEETKPSGPETQKVTSFDSSGSWKTFYDPDGWELGKAQVSKGEAQQAVEDGLTLAEVKAL